MGNWFAKEINIVQQKTEVRAGTLDNFCTLEISLDNPDSWDGVSQNGLPTVDCIGCEDIIEGLEWTRHADGVHAEMAICVCAKKAGPCRVQLTFAPKVRIKESNCYVDSLDVPLTVKIPASCRHSRMTQETLDRIKSSNFEAGKEVVFELQVYDIFGNGLSHADNDSSVKFHGQLKPKTSENKQTGSEDRLTDEACEVNEAGDESNLYRIKFVPLVAGKRELDFRIGGESVNGFPVFFEVVPSRIDSLCSEIASCKVWARHKDILKVTAFDKFKNVVSLNKQFHKLEISSTNSDEANITVLPMTTEDEKRLCRGVIFHTAGEHNVRVSLHATSKDTRVVMQNRLTVNVTLPPISLTQSTVPCASSPMTTKAEEPNWYEDEPVFANGKTFCTIKLKELEACGDDCITSEPSGIKTRIDGKEKTMDDQLQVNSDTMKFEISDIGDTGERLLEVFLREKCIIKLWLNVVGVQDFPEESLRSPRVPNKVGNGTYFALRCEGFKRCVVTGPECSHIDNVNRVYSILVRKRNAKVLVETDVTETNGTVEINLSKLGKEEATAIVVRKLILLTLKGDHFRRQAWEFDSERRKWKQRANEAHDKEQYDRASFSRRTKESYGELMSKAHDKASEYIFDFYNYDRNQSEIDLHELLVADEEKIKEYQRQLQHDRRYKRRDIDRPIIEKRDNDNEAIKKLQHRLENFDHEAARHNHSPWLEIIVGAGHHSHGQRQRIRPEVEKFLQKMEQEYRVINKGSLLVTFEKYGGTQPCVADYYCARCHRTWISALAWVDKSQDCRNRDHPEERCLPFKLRPRDPKSRDSQSTDPTEREKRQVEHTRSCQMCKELGEYCGSWSVTTRRA